MKKLSTSRFLLALTAIGCSALLSAQTIIKVGASQGDKQKTIQMAYDSIVPATIEGAYVLEIQADYDPAVESYPIKLKAKTGASTSNNIIIKPATGVKKVIGPANKTVVYTGLTFVKDDLTLTVPSITGVQTGFAVYGAGLPPYIGTVSAPSYSTVSIIDTLNSKITISSAATGASVADKKTFVGPILTQAVLFDGAKYVTIDGVSRTGDTGLTIQNPNSINCQTVMFTASADNCSLKNCIIRGANVSGTYNNGYQGTIYMRNATNIKVSNCDICDMNDPNIPFPITAFQMTGDGTNSFNEVSDCNVYNVSNYNSTNGNSAIFQFGSAGGQGNKILNNRIFWTKETYVSTFNIMGVGGSMNGLGNLFEGNTIGYESAEGTGMSILKSTTSSTLKAIGNLRNFTCKNNTVANIEFTGANFTAIELGTSVAQTIDPEVVCNNNKIENLVLNQNANGTLAGIIVSIANPYDVAVKNNTIKNLSAVTTTAAHTSTVAGINFTGTGNATYKYTYAGNKISDLLAGSSIATGNNYAYGLRAGLNAVSIERNLIYNVATENANANGYVRGIQTAGSNSNGMLIANNIVRIGNTVMSDATITAYYQEGATTAGDNFKIYNNTFYIGGQAPATATKSSFGFYHTGLAQTNMLKNNIIANKRAIGNTEAHYAIQVVTELEIASSDYNLYQFGKYFGNTSATNAETLELWANAFSSDAHSAVADPLFVAPNAPVPDMNLQETSPARGKGIALTEVTKDFNGFTRTVSDIGALAYGSISGVETAKPSKLDVYGINNAIVLNQLMGQTARIFTMNGQLVKSTEIQSDNEIISMTNGLYIVKVGMNSVKVMVK